MTTTETAFVKCPACSKSQPYQNWETFKPCSLCRDMGTLSPDEWLTCNDPARLVAMLGGVEANRERLTAWANLCEHTIASFGRTTGVATDEQKIRYWTQTAPFRDDTHIDRRTACGWIRCLFANPLIEREQWKELGVAQGGVFEGAKVEIKLPRIDPRWLTDDVRTLVGRVRGGLRMVPSEDYGMAGEVSAYDPPNLHLMPILADALMDAGCDDEEIMRHCLAGTHVGGCWVVEELAKAIERR